jgi:hypothetical protein
MDADEKPPHLTKAEKKAAKKQKGENGVAHSEGGSCEGDERGTEKKEKEKKKEKRKRKRKERSLGRLRSLRGGVQG